MALVVAVLGSAFTVIYTKFLHRKHFVALQSLYQERDSLQIEWQKLRLEHSAWLMQGRVEKVARTAVRFYLSVAKRDCHYKTIIKIR